MARRYLIAVAVMAFTAVFVAPAVQADTGDIIQEQHDPPTAEDGFQALTCDTDTPPCAPDSPPEQFFTQAAGHPPIGFTQYIVKQKEVEVESTMRIVPVGPVETIRVDLPPGLTVNPLATVDPGGNPIRCTLTEFKEEPGPLEPTGCPPETQVGEELVTLKVVAGPGTGTIVPPTPPVTKVPLYNLEPEFGEPAKFGFKVGNPGAKKEVFLSTDVAWESDYHEGFTIGIPSPSPGTLTYKSRLVNFGDKTGDGTYITNPTTCFDPTQVPFERNYSTFLRAQAVSEVDPNFPTGFTPWEASLPPGVMQEGCDAVPFDPSIEVSPGTAAIDSPAAPTVTQKMPFDPAVEGDTGLSQSHIRSARVTLPPGMGINPSGANGLVACSDADFKKGQRVNDNTCPAGSKIGTVEVDTPPLPDGSLVGDVYVGEQQSNDPASGNLYRILVEAKSLQYGVVARLVGRISANPTTGQLTAILNEQQSGQFAGPLPEGLPQVPVETVRLKFDGSKATLTSPSTCAVQTTTTQFEPWARPGTFVSPSADFTLSSDPAGGSCPTTLAARRFAPGYSAKSDSTKAGAYSPFRVRIARVDGEQELKVVNVTLPKGLTGKLAGIPYCSEAAIAAAAASTGAAELANPSCSSASQIGTTSTDSGTGAKPLNLGGKAYLAGPYKGAPLSMVVVTAAKAGPFDLGTVVVRVALNVNPQTAQINAVSDAIPDVFGGAKLDIRLIDVNVDRSQFMLNPTNCAAQATTGTIGGGGGDPTNPAAWSSYAVNAPFQATECNKLAFKPKLFTRLFGPTKRAKNPRIRAILEARNGDANIARTALTLPSSLFLDQSHIKTICTRPQLASMTCPKGAVYGQAEAKSPLLDKKLKGPVYLVASDDPLPNLVADLRGQVRIQLRGVISSKRGGLKTVFPATPDVPVKKFILNMKGGKKSLIVNSQNLCAKKQKAVLNIKAQNGKKVKNNKYGLRISNCGKKKGK